MQLRGVGQPGQRPGSQPQMTFPTNTVADRGYGFLAAANKSLKLLQDWGRNIRADPTKLLFLFGGRGLVL